MAIVHFDGRITHEGLVTGFTTQWNDSMHITTTFAVVWNMEKHYSETVYLRDDYSATWAAKAEVDATDVVLADVAHVAAQREHALMHALMLQREARIEKGKFVQVVRGRKVSKGTRGLVFWTGNNGYGESIGIVTATGDKHFTAITNAVVCGHYETLPATQDERETVETVQAASRAQWLASRPAPKASHHYVRGQYRRG